MIIEEREYRIKPGLREEFWKNYRDKGLPIQLDYLNQPVGFFFIDIGDITNFVHMWPYRDYADREKRTELLHNDPRWERYVPTSHVYILEMTTRVLRCLESGVALVDNKST